MVIGYVNKSAVKSSMDGFYTKVITRAMVGVGVCTDYFIAVRIFEVSSCYLVEETATSS